MLEAPAQVQACTATTQHAYKVTLHQWVCTHTASHLPVDQMNSARPSSSNLHLLGHYNDEEVGSHDITLPNPIII